MLQLRHSQRWQLDARKAACAARNVCARFLYFCELVSAFFTKISMMPSQTSWTLSVEQSALASEVGLGVIRQDVVLTCRQDLANQPLRAPGHRGLVPAVVLDELVLPVPHYPSEAFQYGPLSRRRQVLQSDGPSHPWATAHRILSTGRMAAAPRVECRLSHSTVIRADRCGACAKKVRPLSFHCRSGPHEVVDLRCSGDEERFRLSFARATMTPSAKIPLLHA